MFYEKEIKTPPPLPPPQFQAPKTLEVHTSYVTHGGGSPHPT
jgi:hypothetical protein